MATATIKCPNCGGGLQFNPELQKSKCRYCLSEFTAQDLAAVLQAIEQRADRKRAEAKAAEAAAAAAATPEEAEAARLTAAAKAETAAAISAEASELSEATEQAAAEEASLLQTAAGYVCDSCGAEVMTDATTSATFCYYCHNPILITDRLTGENRPTRIIPFTYDREKAEAAFLKWARSRRFVPKSFYSSSQLEKITGVYLPFWMANYQAEIDIAGKGERVRTWQTGQVQNTETSIYEIARQGTIDIDHIHEAAIRKFDRKLIDSLSPYDERKAAPFSMSYLSGFFAEKFEIPRQEVEPIIENQAQNYTNVLVQEVIGGFDKVDLERNQVDLKVKGWDYALMPAWMLTYDYRGKKYIYAVNGQTGRSFGELPVDNKKLSFTSLIIGLIVLLLVLVGGYFIW